MNVLLICACRRLALFPLLRTMWSLAYFSKVKLHATRRTQCRPACVRDGHARRYFNFYCTFSSSFCWCNSKKGKKYEKKINEILQGTDAAICKLSFVDRPAIAPKNFNYIFRQLTVTEGVIALCIGDDFIFSDDKCPFSTFCAYHK